MMLSHGLIAAGPKEFKFNLTVGGNLRTLALAAGWTGSSRVIATVTATAIAQLTVNGLFPGGVELEIGSGKALVGQGGGRSSGGIGGGFPPSGGKPGLTALTVSVPISVRNNGVIAGGGGGGGGGTGANATNDAALEGGFGGSGSTYGSSAETGGAGAAGGGGTYAGSGGNGGAAGSAGTAGSAGYTWVNGSGYTPTGPGGVGGDAGRAVIGNSYITWLATGTRIGAIA